MKNYFIDDLPDYFKQYKKSIKNPKKFWDKIADENFIEKIFPLIEKISNLKKNAIFVTTLRLS